MVDQAEIQGSVIDNEMVSIINETKQFVDYYESFDGDKSELNSKLSENINQISESLKSDETFIQSLCDLLNNYEPKDDEIYKSLELLAGEIGIVKNNEVRWNVDSQQSNEKPEIEVPQFVIMGNLDDVKGPNDGEENKQDFRNDLVKLRPESEDGIIDNRKLYVVIENIDNLNGRISEFLGNDKLKDKAGLESSRKLLEKIKEVVNHTSPENVKFLQEFIYQNLNQDDGFKTIFERKNKRNGEWDGLFGRYTLKGLGKVVGKFEKYVEDMKNYVDDQSEKENGDGDDDEHNDLDDNGGTSDVDNPEIVENNSFKWNGNEYPQAQNSALLAQGSGLNGANFYSLDSGLKSGVDDDNSDGNLENQSLDNNKDIDYLMEYNGNVYRVKFDSNGNLKPTAQNLESEVNVFFENNSSCIKYLEGKLPEQISNDCVIVWNGSNYAIRYKNVSKGLIILPTTIDGDWIGKDLTESLSLLHFTNFLINESQIDDVLFENDNPDLKMVGDDLCVKVRGWNKGKWYPIPKECFALDGISSEDIKSFIKYINKEGWKDYSLLTKSNMMYKRVRF